MTKRLNNKFFLAALMMALLLGAGCKKKEQQTTPATPQPQQAAKTQLPVQKQPSSAKIAENVLPQLDFKTKKDPFKPFVSAPAASAKGPTPGSRREEVLPIQRYEVTKFKISGIIVGLKENRALIVDPTGKGYVVKEGMPLGNSDGRITRITSSSIEVLEQYREETGHSRKRTIKLTLPQKK